MYTTLKNLTESQRDLLKQLRESVAGLLKPEHDDLYLVKWLVAYRFNKAQAESALRKSITTFRKEFGMDSVHVNYTVPEVLQKYKFHGFLGFDKEGCPVRLILTNKADVKGVLGSVQYNDLIRYIFYVLEDDNIQRLENNKKNSLWAEKNVYIMEFNGFPLFDLFSKSLLELALGIAKMYIGNYPENLKTLAIINAPSFTHIVYGLIKPLLTPEMIPKIKIFGTDGWKEFLVDACGADVIPAYMGGKMTDPDGNPLCVTKVDQGGEIPKECYLQYKARLQPDNPDIHTAIVDIKSTLVVEVPVDDSSAILSWEFQTEKYDIGMGLSYKKDAQTDDKDLEELLPIKRVKCDEVPCEKLHVCEKPGIYVLRFDNSYSWVNQKTLLYKVEVLLSNDIIKTYELEDNLE